jgi:hypothetical protein
MTQQIYINSRQPFTIPDGMVLVHNRVEHTARTHTGTIGFRAWFQEPSDKTVPCDCGWRGREHYRIDE